MTEWPPPRSLVCVIVLLLSLLGCVGCAPEPADPDIKRLDDSTIPVDALTARIEALIAAANVQGLTVTVFNDAQPVYSRAFGHADLSEGRPLRTGTGIYGASLSKAVFGVLVMKLVEQGVVELDTPLQEYVDEPLWQNEAEHWHQNLSDLESQPLYQRITARMCLSHTTGMPNWRWFEPDEKLRIHYEPGERYSYSGEGMVFLQIVLEKITGKPLEQLMQEELFGPYGMQMSSYTWQERFEADYAVGHRADDTTYPRDKDNAARSASTLETTTADYVRFTSAVLRGEGMSKASWDELFRPQIRLRGTKQFGNGALIETDAYDDIELSYGLGWGLLRTPWGRGAFKEGHGDGFQHYTIIFPESGLGVVLLSNSDNAESIFGYLLEATLADTYTPLDWQGYFPYDRNPAAEDDAS
jgi:D-alanyl-D-alanine-carboxypeptidase/D-alanyl-D-alanine-endopeptidase